MTDRDMLIRAICENPAEDTPRLMFADWCDENGESNLAAFVRWQVGSGVEFRREVGPGKWRNRMKRGVDFPTPAAWQGLNSYLGYFWHGDFTVARGFVCAVELPTAAFLEHAESLFRSHPITTVRLVDMAPLDNSDSLNPPDRWFWVLARPRGRADGLMAWEVPGQLADSEASREWRGFSSQPAAREWLSDRCVAYGRELAGLPPLKTVAPVTL